MAGFGAVVGARVGAGAAGAAAGGAGVGMGGLTCGQHILHPRLDHFDDHILVAALVGFEVLSSVVHRDELIFNTMYEKCGHFLFCTMIHRP